MSTETQTVDECIIEILRLENELAKARLRLQMKERDEETERTIKRLREAKETWKS